MAEAAEKSKVIKVGDDDYVLGDKLGYGAFSWAVLAHRTSDSTAVALKFTKHNLTGSDRAIRRQQQEINTELDTFRKVHHKNVVRLHGYSPEVEYEHENGNTEKCYCMALECCEGGELFDIVYYTGKLEEKISRTLFAQIVAGLQAMHKVGLCHRDIKPQNILLTKNFQVKIADFGSSKIFNRQELMKTFRVGTKGYQAPEVLLRRGYTLKCDIFSLGVLLFVILTKHPPFRQAVSEDQWFRQIAKKQFTAFWTKHPKDKLTRPCRDLICKMLCYQPLDRLTIGGVAAHPWSQMDVYSESQITKVMSAKKKQATKGRLNDSARCPANFNSQKTRAAEENIELKPLPEHLEFRVLPCKDHPLTTINYLFEKLAQGTEKICEGVLTSAECKLVMKITTTDNLGFKIEGKEQTEEVEIVIEAMGYSDPLREKVYWLDIAIKSGYNAPAQQFYNTILSLLEMGANPEENEEDPLDFDEIAGEMTDEEKALMAAREEALATLQANLEPEVKERLKQDVLSEQPKKKKKAKKTEETGEEEVAPASP